MFPADFETEAELPAVVGVENECCSWAGWTVACQGGTLDLAAFSSGDGVEALEARFVPAATETSH
jgi:hypothetical protein